jgi:hypothetical protein
MRRLDREKAEEMARRGERIGQKLKEVPPEFSWPRLDTRPISSFAQL